MSLKMTPLLLLAVLTGSLASSQEKQGEYEVAQWSGFRSCAISYTFDDGMACHFSVVTPLFNKYGYRSTLFIMAGKQAPVEKVRQAAAEGHEIASHTITHPNLGQLSVEQQQKELEGSAAFIRQNITGVKGLTMAYPYCVPCSDSMVASTYFAARICSGMIEPKTPANFMRISSVPCGLGSSVNSAEAFNRAADSTAKKGGWTTYLMHAVDDTTGYGNISSQLVEQSLIYLKSSSKTFWVDTFGNVARYIKERNAVKVKDVTITSKSIVASILADLNSEVFNFPLTIRRTLPAGWKSARVYQGGKKVSSAIVLVGGFTSIQFDAVPNAGEIRILKQKF